MTSGMGCSTSCFWTHGHRSEQTQKGRLENFWSQTMSVGGSTTVLTRKRQTTQRHAKMPNAAMGTMREMDVARKHAAVVELVTIVALMLRCIV